MVYDALWPEPNVNHSPLPDMQQLMHYRLQTSELCVYPTLRINSTTQNTNRTLGPADIAWTRPETCGKGVV